MRRRLTLTAATLVAAAGVLTSDAVAQATPQQDQDYVSRLLAVGVRPAPGSDPVDTAGVICQTLSRVDEDRVIEVIWRNNDVDLEQARAIVTIASDVYCPQIHHLRGERVI